MSSSTPSSADLDTLIGLFYPQADALGRFESRRDDELSEDYRKLLAHSRHMTVTVEQRHGSNVDVEVMDVRRTDMHYSRKILLRRQSDHRVVQFGIVRLALSAVAEPARSEILSEQIPLGRVLIKHNVLRSVQLLGLWQVACGPDLASLFSVDVGHVTYGRTALIYCDGEPAVELLEIVAPEDCFPPADPS